MFENLSDKPISEVQNAQADRWEQEDLLSRCVSEREGRPSFVFYEGPPTANGNSSCDRQNAEGFCLPLQDDAGIQGEKKGRLGYPRSPGGNRS